MSTLKVYIQKVHLCFKDHKLQHNELIHDLLSTINLSKKFVSLIVFHHWEIYGKLEYEDRRNLLRQTTGVVTRHGM